eukprot:CAMPEP_0205898508 /NCGR_PEP_ID=MMETSP1083-20121108/26090_1 /ASSEMBLY_ACC=CAM_ASM_000430 /TAXON_ID=97485 /ORGANISM="Prymnesium parvum, Strain Texoma1" /LENGTH=99 /DNA_ID=CAMNT_0053263783 /DNA_START=80 /DNA_END=377 /DNA_ORIENTATION=-
MAKGLVDALRVTLKQLDGFELYPGNDFRKAATCSDEAGEGRGDAPAGGKRLLHSLPCVSSCDGRSARWRRNSPTATSPREATSAFSQASDRSAAANWAC